MQGLETYVSSDETDLARDTSLGELDEAALDSESARIEIAEVGTIFTGMAISLLMGIAMWLTIIITVVIIF